MRSRQLYKSGGADEANIKAICEAVGGDERTAFVAFQSAGFIKRKCSEKVAKTGFGHAEVKPVAFSEHSGFDEIVDFVKVIRKYGLEKEGLFLLTSYGSVMEERVAKRLEWRGLI